MKMKWALPLAPLCGLAAILSLGACAGGGGGAQWKSEAPQAPSAAPDAPREGRAIWVARFHYKTPDDVRAIIRNCAETGFNQVLFQVRGNGTVYYRSEIEPWAWELTGGGPENLGKDPGWDPLALAIEEAHARGIELHAWVNVYPGWRGEDWPPPAAPQLWNQHPEWFMRWKDGSVMLPYYMRNDRKVVWYSFINPGVPEVNDYLLGVFDELASRYPIDGLHLDYIRYPHDLAGWDFSYDEVSLRRFREAAGRSPDEAPEEWNRWRANQVTDLVRRLRAHLAQARPGAALTAAVGRHGPHNMQYATEWLQEGLLDAAVIMNYSKDPETYRSNIRAFVEAKSEKAIYSGMGPYTFANDPGAAEKFRALMRASAEEGAAGVAQFSYETLFGSDHQPREFARILREEFYATPARSPLRP